MPPPFPRASRLPGRRPRAEETSGGTRGSPQALPAQPTLPLPPRAESLAPRVASCPRPSARTFPVSAPSPPAPAHPHGSAAATSTGSGPGRAAPPRLAAGGGGGGEAGPPLSAKPAGRGTRRDVSRPRRSLGTVVPPPASVPLAPL